MVCVAKCFITVVSTVVCFGWREDEIGGFAANCSRQIAKAVQEVRDLAVVVLNDQYWKIAFCMPFKICISCPSASILASDTRFGIRRASIEIPKTGVAPFLLA